jgi:hypothetical protein
MHSLTSALDGSESSSSRPGRFTPMGRVPSTHWIGGQVGPRAVLDAVMKRKISSSPRKPNSRIPIIQPVAQWLKARKSLNWDCRKGAKFRTLDYRE